MALTLACCWARGLGDRPSETGLPCARLIRRTWRRGARAAQARTSSRSFAILSGRLGWTSPLFGHPRSRLISRTTSREGTRPPTLGGLVARHACLGAADRGGLTLPRPPRHTPAASPGRQQQAQVGSIDDAVEVDVGVGLGAASGGEHETEVRTIGRKRCQGGKGVRMELHETNGRLEQPHPILQRSIAPAAAARRGHSGGVTARYWASTEHCGYAVAPEPFAAPLPEAPACHAKRVPHCAALIPASHLGSV
jgi:hypothetical protein